MQSEETEVYRDKFKAKLNSFKNTDVIFVAGTLSHDKYVTCPFQPGCYIDGFWLPLDKSLLIKIIFQKENHEMLREWWDYGQSFFSK